MVVKSYSWTVYDNRTAIKQTDLSVFKNHGSDIPVKIRPYFSIDDLEKGDNIQIKIHFDDKIFQAKLERIRSTAGQTRIMWGSDLSDQFNQKFERVIETHEYPELRFYKINAKEYDLEFIYIDSDEDFPVDRPNELESKITVLEGTEGRKVLIYTTKYERNPANRREALRIHGTRCMACGFDFEKMYGDRGRNYIEVHHIKPLSHVNEEILVNPETDLICLCSNCHRIVHRKKNAVLTLEELKELIEEQKRHF